MVFVADVPLPVLSKPLELDFPSSLQGTKRFSLQQSFRSHPFSLSAILFGAQKMSHPSLGFRDPFHEFFFVCTAQQLGATRVTMSPPLIFSFLLPYLFVSIHLLDFNSHLTWSLLFFKCTLSFYLLFGNNITLLSCWLLMWAQYWAHITGNHRGKGSKISCLPAR
jgi:hypothetical protein